MGPYYVTSLVHLLGPVTAVMGRSSRATHERVVATGPRANERFPVEVDTHVVALLEHASGALSTITMSFDAVHTTASFIEVHGESGSLALPDPNRFDGPTLLWRDPDARPEELPASAGFVDSSRGVGLLDLIRSEPGQERASGALGMHVLEVMLAILDSGRTGERGIITSTVERPPLVPLTTAEKWRSHT
jgi:predicted dehydrogenase